MPPPQLSHKKEKYTLHLRRRGTPAFLSAFLFALPSAAHWPSSAEGDGVYGRLRGNTDLSLKLGGLISDSRIAGSVGASAHYYSLIGVTGDYTESLSADTSETRSLSVGMELRPLFLPRWLLGLQRGPAWLDLTLDATCIGFGAYFGGGSTELDDTRGVWASFGLGVPVFGHAGGPWLELRLIRRFPDRDAFLAEPRNALMVYLSWHHVLQLSSNE